MRGRRFLGVLLLAALGAQAGELDGEQAFAACAACHSLAPGAAHKVGPNLFGLAGRRAASQPGYRYSPALQASELTWNRGTLTTWIVATEALVPGNWMLFHSPLAPAEVPRLVDYILSRQPEGDG
ncbi:c-type cytochrome [Pseudohaliea sp.]|uniref:c-type cytochrome n=1 Tax=Pseudohaliea sp. TaxID=2740289 RepID=UPI0032ED735E